MKTCPKCKVAKPLDAFGVDRSQRDGIASGCKACSNAAAAKRYVKHPRNCDLSALATAHKKCSRCKEIKPALEFHRRSGKPHLLVSWCKVCVNASCTDYSATHTEQAKEVGRIYREKNKAVIKERQRAFLERNPDYPRGSAMKRNYGVTLAQYDEMLSAQNSRCAICGTDTPVGRGKKLHVDHDHETGVVRGLLCNKCNAGIGLLGDNFDVLRRAAQYVGPPRDAILPGF